MKTAKTNAMRLLDQAGAAYTPLSYETADGVIDGLSVARKVQRPPQEVFKTLVARGASGAVAVFCLPVCEELNLKEAARAAGEKNVAMLPVADIAKTTGYVRGGVSPIGMKKLYPTFLSRRAQALPAILVSGGRIGLQIELAPQVLLTLIHAQWMP